MLSPSPAPSPPGPLLQRSCSPPARHPDPDPDIVLSASPALVSWSRSDNTLQYVGKKLNGANQGPTPCWLKCDIRYSSTSQTALFKLNIGVLLKAQHHTSKNTANLFVMIDGEQVNALRFHTDSEHDKCIPSTVRNLLSPDAVCLDFTLSSPPTVIAPHYPDPLVPKNEQAAYILSSLQSLAVQAKVTISLSNRVLSRSALEILCTAASNHALGRMKQYGNISTLYGGKGGRILYPSPNQPGSKVDTEFSPHIVENPPAYDQLGPGPPLLNEDDEASFAHSSDSQKKRPRSRSNSGSGSVKAKRPMPEPAAASAFDSHGRNGSDTPKELTKELDCNEALGMTGEVKDQLENMERRLANRLQHFLTDLLKKHKEEVVSMVEQRLEEHWGLVETRLEKHEEYMQENLEHARAEIEGDVEEQLVDRKCELDQMVKDEREDLEDSIREQVEDGLAVLEETVLDRLRTAKAVFQFG